MMSHEIRTPVAVIQGYVDLLNLKPAKIIRADNI
jgi:signal transduction histidine kinase